jgi:hypothetical protein
MHDLLQYQANSANRVPRRVWVVHALHAKAEMCTDFEGEEVLVLTRRVAAIRGIEERFAPPLLHLHNSPKCIAELVVAQVPPAVAAR